MKTEITGMANQVAQLLAFAKQHDNDAVPSQLRGLIQKLGSFRPEDQAFQLP